MNDLIDEGAFIPTNLDGAPNLEAAIESEKPQKACLVKDGVVQVGERTGANTPEPMPPTDSREPAVWDLFFASFIVNADVERDIRERDKAGETKYGTRLRLRNGRNAKVDLYQELLDAVVYATQSYFEQPPPRDPHARSRIDRLIVEAELVRAELRFEESVRASAAGR